ncbi:hypothetical protein BDU57DRAFT_577270 [Ampelomyces quisqualis]|uniref:Uncharacterized protein n=1 Tax=Ampelomyces quisqualis TaxID=50730 RepID=A0A6A5QKY7_AMPQU|nr:hypothetical protein BDU57DRAFT_577270 [Ampelomyces quisqualis]
MTDKHAAGNDSEFKAREFLRVLLPFSSRGPYQLRTARKFSFLCMKEESTRISIAQNKAEPRRNFVPNLHPLLAPPGTTNSTVEATYVTPQNNISPSYPFPPPTPSILLKTSTPASVTKLTTPHAVPHQLCAPSPGKCLWSAEAWTRGRARGGADKGVCLSAVVWVWFGVWGMLFRMLRTFTVYVGEEGGSITDIRRGKKDELNVK